MMLLLHRMNNCSISISTGTYLAALFGVSFATPQHSEAKRQDVATKTVSKARQQLPIRPGNTSNLNSFHFRHSYVRRQIITMLLSLSTFSHAHRSATAFMTRHCHHHHRTILSSAKSLLLEIPTPEDMQEIGALLSIHTGPSDVILMDGDLGAGKTCFSRGFVRARSNRPDERVTSPTYLLSNTYPTPDGIMIHHMDLYRLRGPDDLGPLNIDHVFQQCISLIEWPSRLGSRLPETRLHLTFHIRDADLTMGRQELGGVADDDEATTRILKLEPHGLQWEERLEFLVQQGYIDDLLLEEDNNKLL